MVVVYRVNHTPTNLSFAGVTIISVCYFSTGITSVCHSWLPLLSECHWGVTKAPREVHRSEVAKGAEVRVFHEETIQCTSSLRNLSSGYTPSRCDNHTV